MSESSAVGGLIGSGGRYLGLSSPMSFFLRLENDLLDFAFGSCSCLGLFADILVDVAWCCAASPDLGQVVSIPLTLH